MHVRLRGVFSWLPMAAVLLCGCPREDFVSLLAPTMQDIDKIVSDTSLTPVERRTRLELLGVNDLTINALMQSERLGNQYGGEPRSAYTKVSESRFTTLTPDEAQYFADGASAASTTDELSVTLTDDEAQAMVAFFVDHDLSSKEALASYLDEPSNPVPASIPDGVLRSLFIDFDLSQLVPNLP